MRRGPAADVRADPRSAAAGPSAPHPARRTPRRASVTPRQGIAGRQMSVARSLTDPHAARLGVGDGDEPNRPAAPSCLQPIASAGSSARREGGRRKAASPAHPRLHQRAAAAALGLPGRHRHRKALGRDPRRVHGDAPCLDEGRVVVLVGAGGVHFNACGSSVSWARRTVMSAPSPSSTRSSAVQWRDPAAAPDDAEDLARIEALEVPRQRLERAPRRGDPADQIAVDCAVEVRDDACLGAIVGEQLRHQRRRGQRAKAAVQPMTGLPVRRHRPTRRSGAGRQETAARPRSTVDRLMIDHAAAVERRNRVGGFVEIGVAAQRQSRRETPAGSRSSRRPAREMRHDALRRLRIEEDVRLVGAPVDRRAAELGEPDRLRLRHPRGRRRRLDAARPVVMRVRPPAAEVLVAEHPRLAVAPSVIGVRDLRVAVGGAGVVPVEALAAGDVGLQVGAVVDRGPALGRVDMVDAVAPVGERHVVVDADEVDVGVGPERVEVEDRRRRSRRPAGGRSTRSSRRRR